MPPSGEGHLVAEGLSQERKVAAERAHSPTWAVRLPRWSFFHLSFILLLIPVTNLHQSSAVPGSTISVQAPSVHGPGLHGGASHGYFTSAPGLSCECHLPTGGG